LITCTAAITGSAGALTAELVRTRSVAVRSISTVLWIVLPLALATLAAVHVAIRIVVLIVIIIVVDLHVATIPIAIPPVAAPGPPCSSTKRDPCTPHQSRPWHITGIGVGIIRIINRSSSVNDRRVVRWHVNDVWVRLLNLDHLLTAGHRLSLHHLLRAGL